MALNGAGASFPYPLYSKWSAEYHRRQPRVAINYQSIGSGGGVRQLLAGTVDFGASEVPLGAGEAPDGQVLLHVPTAIGSVVVGYNLPALRGSLRLTGELLAQVFLGRITRWNAPELVAVNPGAALPDLPISVVYRTDGSGTTSVLTEYLAQASRDFRERVGAGKSVRWPAGLGAKGNEGVTGKLQVLVGALGCTELAYATQNRVQHALLQNRSGTFVAASPESAGAAGEAVSMPDSLNVSLAAAASSGAYPLATYTYLIVRREARDARKGQALARFLWWAVHEGQHYARGLDYAPLPAFVVAKVEAALRTLRAGGKPVLFTGTLPSD